MWVAHAFEPNQTKQRILQLPLRQWGASNIYFLVLSIWKVNIAENPIAVIGVVDTFELCYLLSFREFQNKAY